MTARDDYPLDRVEFGASDGVAYCMDPAQWKDMCDEIDRLRTERDSLRRAYEMIAASDNGVEQENEELRELLTVARRLRGARIPRTSSFMIGPVNDFLDALARFDPEPMIITQDGALIHPPRHPQGERPAPPDPDGSATTE